jgi:glutamate-1-semialdehyde 2,1-aminomutase
MEALDLIVREYLKRTPTSAQIHSEAQEVMPLGVSSNFRALQPHPLHIARASGARMWDVDGNEYIDFNMAFGALMSGHAHPLLVQAVSEQMQKGSLYCIPKPESSQLARELIRRFPIEMVRFANSGSEATMHAVRLARAYTGREYLLKFEGGYHGGYDSGLVGLKPPGRLLGRESHPPSLPASLGIPAPVAERTLVASFNDLGSVRRQLETHENQVAAVIVEPVMLNLGVCLPEGDFLTRLQELCHEFGTLLIFDEVKTGVKIAPGGACEYFSIRPDLVCLAKSIGGGLPLAAFGGRREIMSLYNDFSTFHGGTYAGNPLSIRAGLVTLGQILVPEAYARVFDLNRMLLEGCREIVKRHRLRARVDGIGSMGAILFVDRPIRNYRDFLHTDTTCWRAFWLGMNNLGIIPQGVGYDEQWTLSVQHTQDDIGHYLEAFDRLAPLLR